MDILSKLAEAWSTTKKQNDDAEGGLPPALLASMRAPAGKLEKDMKFGGAEIQIPREPAPSPTPAPQEPAIQDMPATEIQAEAPQGRESKYTMLNRIHAMMSANKDELAPSPERVQSLNDDIAGLREKAGRIGGRGSIDLSDFESKIAGAEKNPEWNQSDYMKAALIAILPTLAGGIAGGLGGAAAGAAGGQKGIEFGLKSAEDKRSRRVDGAHKNASNRINAYKAETEAAGKEIRTLADLVKLDIEMNGKLSKPLAEYIQKMAPQYTQAEIETYGNEIRDEGTTSRSIMEGDRKSLEGGLDRDANKSRYDADRIAKRDAADADRRLREDTADADRISREKMGKLANATKAQVAKAKGAGAGKPPNGEQKSYANFANLMDEADIESEQYWKTGSFDATDKSGFVDMLIPDRYRTATQTPDSQAYEHAKRKFVQAKLRKESGAAISTPEFEQEMVKAFPIPNDSPQTIEMKRQYRKSAIAGFRAAAGDEALNNISRQKGDQLRLDPVIERYAKQFNLSYGVAKDLLVKKRGYKPKESVPFKE